MDDHEFEMLLKRRDVPDAPSNMSHRIIEASKNIPQGNMAQGKSRFVIGDWFSRVTEKLMMPQPALALGVFLLLAIGLGVFSGDIVNISDNGAQDVGDVSLAFYVDDLFGADDYL
ncbi:MAG: hypothetical protein GW778_02695 [Alphaproteobacteria bacterium]|nr:hypothetical protein [Alphaproteobacteria bacterium]